MATASFPANLVIPPSKLEWKEKIGAGGCGEVYRVLHKDWGPLAVKRLGVTMDVKDKTFVTNLREEAATLRELRNSNIIEFNGVVWSAPHFGVAMPLAENGTLDSFIKKYYVKWATKVDFLHQAGSGMTYLHTLPNHVIHGDLKIGNLLLDKNLVVKVADFGLSQWRNFQTTHTDEKLREVSGTITHLPPESLSNINTVPNMERDVYSFGILAWELFTQHPPFRGCDRQHIMCAVRDGQRPNLQDLPDDTPSSIKELIPLAWAQRPEARPTITVIKTSLSELSAKHDSVIKVEKLALMSQIMGLPSHAPPPTPTSPQGGGHTVFTEQDKSSPKKENNSEATGGSWYSRLFSSQKSNAATANPPSVTLTPAGSLELGFEANKKVGISLKGLCIVSKEGGTTLSMYKYYAGKYDAVWEKNLPEGVTSLCAKFVAQCGDIILQNRDGDTTTRYNYGLSRVVNSIDHRGTLCSRLRQSVLMYLKRNSEGKMTVKTHIPELTLHKPCGREWGLNVSASQLSSGNIALVEHFDKSMDIYTSKGEHLHHINLSYTPQWLNTVTTCGNTHVIVAQFRYPPTLHVYASNGDVLHKIEHKQLGLSDKQHVWNVTCSLDGKTLHLAVGTGNEVTALHAYKIKLERL